MAFAPDGRLFVCQQNGQLRVVKDGALLSQPFVTLATDVSGERGLLGVTFDPGFATNRHLYVYYTLPSSPSSNRVSRLTANGDTVLPGSEVVLLNLDELSETAANHNGGALHFGSDGKLYIAVGDNARSFKSQSLDNLMGKILRLNRDGTIPTDNPFYATAEGVNRSAWAIGLRNPFTFAIQPGTGRMFINDVGEVTWEEINEGQAGANFGWPDHEGDDDGDAATADPRFAYGHGTGSDEGCAITGGVFYNPPNVQFPSAFVGKYFFADFCGGWIRVLNPDDPEDVSDFATGISAPVSLEIGPDGALYYLSRGNDSLYKIQATGSPGIVVPPGNQIVPPGAAATFAVAASGTEPLVYQWRCNGTNLPVATNVSYQIAAASAAHNGTAFSVVVMNPYGCVTSSPALLVVTTDPPPVASITTPSTGTLYRAGDTIHFMGSATVGSGPALPESAFSWTVVFHHAQHTHPFYGPVVGVTNGSFIIPTSGETASDVFYRIHLTVTNAAGFSSSTSTDVTPRTSVISLATSPPGLQVTLGGQPFATPLTFTGVVGITRSLGVISPQPLNGANFGFVKWSDGGAAVHGITTPESNTTYTASFIAAGTSPALNLARAGQDLVLSWPAISTGYVVQATHTLTPAVQWERATNHIVTTEAWCGTTANPSAGEVYYRLTGTNPGPPRLNLSRTGSKLLLQWPTQAVGYVLETRSKLTGTELWKPATNPVSNSNGWFTAMADASAGLGFFRLAGTQANTPQLSLSLSGSLLVLQWPAQPAGYVLESTHSLTPVVPWAVMTNPIGIIGEQHEVLVLQPQGNQFYRLFKP